MYINQITGVEKREDAFTCDIIQHIELVKSHIKKYTIKTRAFTPKVEKTTGADWLLIVEDKAGSYICLLIQAKKIKKRKYDINYNTGKQRKALLSFAKSHNITPIYCLYNYFDNLPSFPIKCHNELYGCTVASAHTFKSKSSTKADSISNFSYPLHYLFCNDSSPLSSLKMLDER